MTSPRSAAPVTEAPEALRATAVLLDLDGTITDSAPAITSAIAETLAAFGYPPETPEQLLRHVGPPIRDGLLEFGGVREEDLEPMVLHYRALYAQRMLDVALFPGVPELIRSLRAAGVPLAVATSKMRHMAVPILEHAGLADEFTVICGATPDESRSTKGQIVEDALAGLSAAGADISRAVMVGDRHHDVDGATEHGIPVILVEWGYARPGEEEGAHAVVRDADELAAVLGAS
ncbi:HAD hydrolase-like protein [Georgenia sp. SUBG003]|uniref:HAD hydrolase-like protein n=1 Tax=Georgenia sp. SUBG003 TaxID=1497974 RepID=UPI0004D9483E|nr:hypothetical protein DA06_09225 [Georgenia sp. SUBG003]